MRSVTTLALIFAAGIASADRLITIPTGSKITLNTVKAESLWEQSSSRTVKSYLGFGVTDAIDMQITTERYQHTRTEGSFDFSYNIIPPIVGIGPGISVGVQDVLNTSRDGRRYFIAITSKEGFADSVNGTIPAEFTLGGYLGSVTSPFVGVMLPFTDRVRFLAEFNGRRISAGVDLRPFRNLGLKAVFEDRDVLIGAQITVRF